jgi:hypothetical protein
VSLDHVENERDTPVGTKGRQVEVDPFHAPPAIGDSVRRRRRIRRLGCRRHEIQRNAPALGRPAQVSAYHVDRDAAKPASDGRVAPKPGKSRDGSHQGVLHQILDVGPRSNQAAHEAFERRQVRAEDRLQRGPIFLPACLDEHLIRRCWVFHGKAQNHKP